MVGDPDCRFTGAALIHDIDNANGNSNDVKECILEAETAGRTQSRCATAILAKVKLGEGYVYVCVRCKAVG
jgi:hypothetical protein